MRMMMVSPSWRCVAVLAMAVTCLGSHSSLCEHMVVENARFLHGSNGAQAANWVSTVTQLMPFLDLLGMRRTGPSYAMFDVELHLEDSASSNTQINALLAELTTNGYVRLTLEAARQAFGVNLTLTTARLKVPMPANNILNNILELPGNGTNGTNGTYGTAPANATAPWQTPMVDAGQFPSDDRWWRFGGVKFTEAALQVAACDVPPASVSDVLVYNREGNRSITNTLEISQLLQADGLTTTVVTVTGDLTPAQQICVVSKPYKYIITPHGGHMAALMFKYAGTAIVEVSPPKGVLDTLRFIRPEGEPWYALQGRLLWVCGGFCVDTVRIFKGSDREIAAVLLPLDCPRCAREVGGAAISVDLDGIMKLASAARTRRLTPREAHNLTLF